MRKLYLFILISLLFANCSDDDISDMVGKYPVPIKLTASTRVIEPFEKIDIGFIMSDEDLTASYDSIIWISNGLWSNMIFSGIPDNYNPLDELREKEITDFQIGKHVTKVYGYKNGVIISRDSVEFEVKQPTGDFLCVRWNTAKKDQSQKIVTGLTPVNYNQIRKWVYMGISQMVKTPKIQSEYVVLDYSPWYSGNNPWVKEEHEMEREYTRTLWRDYITSVYGNSSFLYDGSEASQNILWEEYNKRFKNRLSDGSSPYIGDSGYFPVEIWDAPRASICLYTNVHGGWYRIIAEPK